MGLTVKDTGSDFQLAPEGTHIARCYQVIDLGLQATNFGNKHKIYIGWELPNETMDDGKPFMVGARYTASLNEKANLTAHLESWRGKKFTDAERKGFELFSVLGAPCMVTIVHNESNGKTYANVTAVTSVPKGTTVPDAVNPPVKFSLEDYSDAAFSALPEWMQKTINLNGVGQTPASESENPADGMDDQIPF